MEEEDGDVEVPREGMVFSSEQEVYTYYKKYAATVGFNVRRSNTKAVAKNGDRKVKYFSIACSRSRKPASAAKNRKNYSQRTDCKAKINLVVDSDRRLVVSKVQLDHNHDLGVGRALGGPGRSVSRNESVDSKNLHSVGTRDGNLGNLHAEERRFRYHIKNQNHLKLGIGDAEAIQDYFLHAQKKDSNFHYIVDLNEEGRLRNLFWVDSRSRGAYETFGDVVLFDTTYIIDKYDLPLTLFLGVNHHRQSVLLGCGLISSDDTETYVWLFRSWLTCMSDCSPKAIITDQCNAIQDAVLEVFPNAHHRLCLWHIWKKVPQNLGSLTQYEGIRKTLKCVVYESLQPEEFEQNWRKMLQEYYCLVNNEWLLSLFSDRHQWVPVFVNGTFWAGMSITQRGEKVTSFFDGHLNSKTSLKQFMERYDISLRSKIEKENKADIASSSTSISLVSDLYFEKQFRELYTNDIFKLFQDELKGLIYCNTSFLKADGPISTYEVTDSVKVKDNRSRREVAFDVFYNETECEARCSCHFFESKGILCRHLIAVLMKMNFNEVPSCYIISRWKKDVKRRYTFHRSSYDDFCSNSKMQRFDKLCNYFKQIVEIGVETHGKYKLLMECLSDMKEKLLQNQSKTGYTNSPPDPPAPSREIQNEVLNGITNSSNWWLYPLQVQTIPTQPPTKLKEVMIGKNKEKMAKPMQPLMDVNVGIAGNNRSFLRYHYIQMYPEQPNVTHGMQNNNQLSCWQNLIPSVPVQQNGRSRCNISTASGSMDGDSSGNHQNKNSNPVQTNDSEPGDDFQHGH